MNREKYVLASVRVPRPNEWLSDAPLVNGALPATMEVYVDGKPGVCGGVQKMNDATHFSADGTNNVRIDEDGFAKAATGPIRQGDELTQGYNLGRRQDRDAGAASHEEEDATGEANRRRRDAAKLPGLNVEGYSIVSFNADVMM